MRNKIMQFDFWNNPLVVSAMRLKYRRGSPGIVASLYVMSLLAIGSILFHNQVNFSMPLGRVFLLTIFSLQFVLSAIVALFMVSNSMNAEVNNRTLDFQRIVSLSPREILLGKIVGEPLLAYFLAMATLPLVVICWFLGGATLPVIVLLYVNLFSFTFMCASLGLLHPLTEPNQTLGKPRSGSLGVLFFVLLGYLPWIILSGNASSNPWMRTVLSLLTPIESLIELKNGTPFQAQIELWGLSLPSLVIAPLAQLAVAGYFIKAMARRLENPINTVFGRKDIYVILTIVDLIVAGMCFTEWQQGSLLNELLSHYCFAHVIACVVLIMGATPSRSMLKTWLWRFRGQQSWSRDSLLLGRAEITIASFAMCGIGGAIFLLGFTFPILIASANSPKLFVWSQLFEMGLVTGILIVALGALCQLCQALVRKQGLMLFAVIVLILNVLPPLLGGILLASDVFAFERNALDPLFGMSAIVFYFSRMGYSNKFGLSSLPLVIMYLMLGIACLLTLRRWLRLHLVSINKKIDHMLKSTPSNQAEGEL